MTANFELRPTHAAGVQTPALGMVDSFFIPLGFRPPDIYKAGRLLITEVLYQPDATQGNIEWFEILNASNATLSLRPFKIGDEEELGGAEGMLRFPQDSVIRPGEIVIIAENADIFESVYGFPPDFEFKDSGSTVPEMVKYSAWTGGNVSLTNSGDELFILNRYDEIVDAVSWGRSNWAFDPDVTPVDAGASIERFPGYHDSDNRSDWRSRPVPSPGKIEWSILTPTPSTEPSQPPPTAGPSATPAAGSVVISEVLYDPTGSEPDAEWFEMYNASGNAIDLTGYRIGDEETQGGSEGMFAFPEGSVLGPGEYWVVANDGLVFAEIYAFVPDFELAGSHSDSPDLIKYTAWSGGNISLSNAGDELLLLDPGGNIVDAVSWGASTWAFNPGVPDVPAGKSIERYPPGADTDQWLDWREQPSPSPGSTY